MRFYEGKRPDNCSKVKLLQESATTRKMPLQSLRVHKTRLSVREPAKRGTGSRFECLESKHKHGRQRGLVKRNDSRFECRQERVITNHVWFPQFTCLAAPGSRRERHQEGVRRTGVTRLACDRVAGGTQVSRYLGSFFRERLSAVALTTPGR